jgi:hypothetical protein
MLYVGLTEDHEESARLFAHIDMVIKSRYRERLRYILGHVIVNITYAFTVHNIKLGYLFLLEYAGEFASIILREK